MSVARWYPTATTLPDGRVFVVSGDTITLGENPDPTTPVPLINSSDTLPEIYNPATDTWTAHALRAARRMPLYPFIFVLPNGKLFDAGPDTITRTLDLATGQWTDGRTPARSTARARSCTGRARSSSPAPGPIPSSRAARRPTARRRST